MHHTRSSGRARLVALISAAAIIVPSVVLADRDRDKDRAKAERSERHAPGRSYSANGPERWQRETHGRYEHRRSPGPYRPARPDYRRPPPARGRPPVRRAPPGYHHRDIIIVPPPHRRYPRYRRFYHDDDFWGWMAFTAITLKLLDNLNEQQQREHEAALYRATRAPLGNTIIWREGRAQGAVTPIREGHTTSGQYCREFQHEITVGGRSQAAYGTACRRPDGSWEIVE